MKKTAIWLIIATILVVTGTVAFIIALSMNNWDFKRFDTTKYVTNTYEINDDFNDLLLHTTEADIIFMPSDDNICKVICYEAETAKHDVIVKDNALTINVDDQRKWYNYINISLSSPSITVYLPKSEYNSLSVKTNTGAIRVKNITTDNLELSTTTGSISVDSVKCTNDIKLDVTTGSVTVKNTHCNNFSSDGDTGMLSLDNLISDGIFDIERTTGGVKFKHCDASEIYVKTSTGNVSGSLLSEKTFVTETTTGVVKVPKNTTGGKCEITTTTGNIKIELTATEG